MSRTQRQRLLSGLLLLTLCCILASCGSGGIGGGNEGKIKFVHALAAQGPIDIYFNNKQVNTGLNFAGTTNYIEQASGSIDIQVYDHATAKANLLADRTINLGSGEQHTFIFTRTQQTATPDTLVLLPADDTIQPAQSSDNIRFVNTQLTNTEDNGGVDIYFAASGSLLPNLTALGNIPISPLGITGPSNEGQIVLNVTGSAAPCTVLTGTQYITCTGAQYEVFVTPPGQKGNPYLFSSSPLIISLGNEQNRTWVLLDPVPGNFAFQSQLLHDIN